MSWGLCLVKILQKVKGYNSAKAEIRKKINQPKIKRGECDER